MNGFIKLFKTVSRRSGKPMLSSAYSYETPIGRAFQGSNSADDKPWFIMIKDEVHPDSVDDVMWFNPSTKALLTEQEYSNLGQSEPTGDSVDESSGEIATS